MKKFLQPYFPISYSMLVDKYFIDGYFAGGNHMDTPQTYDGLNVEMYAGDIHFWK